MKTFRTIIAFFQSLLPLIGFGIIGLAIYTGLESPFNIIIAGIFIILGLFVSRLLFNMMRRRGIISVMSGSNSAYELNELEPVEGDGVTKLTPEELQNIFKENKFDLKECTLSIWGDWEGRQLDFKHKIQSIEYNSEKNILSIQFFDNCILKVKKPRVILSADSYLKIVKATEILWQVPENSGSYSQYSYLNSGGKIITKSNTDWKPHKYDIGIGMNALYLQG